MWAGLSVALILIGECAALFLATEGRKIFCDDGALRRASTPDAMV